MSSSAKRQWLVPAGLILLSLVPMLAGAARVGEIAGGAPVTPDNARFFASPVPVLVHIVGASVYCLLGAFQFAPGLRRRRPGWHRIAGRVLVPCGLAAALSGVWMALFYPRPPIDDVLLTPMRLVFGAAMAGCLVLGVAAIRRRDIARHRAWMARGYAIGLGAGTQVLTHLPWMLLVGQPSGFGRVLLMLAGWLINLAAVEWALRRGGPRPPRAVARRAGRPRRRRPAESSRAVTSGRGVPGREPGARVPDSGGSRDPNARAAAMITLPCDEDRFGPRTKRNEMTHTGTEGLAIAACGLLFLGAVFQVGLSAGAPWAAAAYGGRVALPDGRLPSRYRVASLITAVAMIAIGWLFLLRGGVVGSASENPALALACWGLAALFALNTLGNLAGRHPLERWGMGALTASLAVLCVLLAIG